MERIVLKVGIQYFSSGLTVDYSHLYPVYYRVVTTRRKGKQLVD